MAGRKKQPKQIAPNWGGAGRGQGRPELPPEQKSSVTLFFRILPSDAARISAQGREGENRNATARRMLLEALEQAEQAAQVKAEKESPNWMTCRLCGQRFAPGKKRKWCHICHEPIQ